MTSKSLIRCLRTGTSSTQEQTCLLLRFGRKVYALKALFTLLRLRCQILRFLAAVTDFESSTIDLCDKSYRLSSKTAAE